MNMYQNRIREELARQGFVGKYDPRHIEAYMRIGHSTLDALSPKAFALEVAIGMACVDEEGTKVAEACAQSFAL
jgi:hypothetical protein